MELETLELMGATEEEVADILLLGLFINKFKNYCKQVLREALKPVVVLHRGKVLLKFRI